MHRTLFSRIISTPNHVPVRFKSRKTRLAPGTDITEKALWSNGEVGQHPGPPDSPMGNKGQYPHDLPPDSPMGNKGQYPHDLPDGGKQYYGFAYYPRYPNQQDPEDLEPAPLHMVTRTRCLKRKPWYEKEIMKNIGLDGKRSDVSVMKNNPENNARLWKVKHLIKITPLRVPTNLPKDIDPKDCFIKETGEFCHTPNIGPLKAKVEEDAKLTKPSFNGNDLLNEARRRWQSGWEVEMK